MSSLPSGTVTFLFTDIEGSTKLAQSHADKWESLRARHHAILKSAIESNNGYVFQIIGDAFCATFHTAGDALRAAAQSQTDLHNEDWGGAPIKVRMGINTGTAQASIDNDHSGGYKGYTAMARVQRLMSAGHGGQILLSLATSELVRDNLPGEVSLRDLGEQRLKDLNRPEHIYQLVSQNLPFEFPPLKTLESYQHNLPVQLTSFIGREEEMAEIKQAIDEHRLVTLIGSGGTGKTRLALQVAADMLDRFPDGVWFAELGAITDPDFIPQTILSVLGIPEQSGMTAQQLLMDYLREKKFLMIMDNCEHLLEASAKLVESLVNNATESRIMTTSREALTIKGELTWQVPSLSLPDSKQPLTIKQFSQYEAMQLFVERATLVQPQFLVTSENAPIIAQICIRLDGIPLAIELAAARVRALSVEHIFKRLDDRFRLLTGGSRTALERHQTLRATIDWSYNLLVMNERTLLFRLSVFSGGWTLEAAEQVCVETGSDFDILDLLIRLVDKSLVILDGSRYRMLDTTRQYAREKLLDSQEGTTQHNKHMSYYLNLAEYADQQVHGPDQIEWINRLEKEFDNFRAALDWCISEKNTESALRLLDALHWVWGRRGHHSEIESWFDQIRTQPEAGSYPAPYASLLTYIGSNKKELNIHSAKAVLNESREIWLKLGVEGEQGLAKTLDELGDIALYNEEDIGIAQALFEQSFQLYQKHEDKGGIAWLINRFGEVAVVQGHYAEAEELHLKSLAKFQELGDKSKAAYVLGGLGELMRVLEDYERATLFWEQNLGIFRELGGGFSLVYPFLGVAWASLHEGDYLKAKGLFEESLRLSKESRNKAMTHICLIGLAGVMGMTAKPEQACRLFGAAESLFENIGHLEPADQKDFDHYTAVVRGQLDQALFDTIFNEGRAMTMEQAIEMALEATDD